jgi:hypothetical protein
VTSERHTAPDPRGGNVVDLAYIALTVALFALAMLLVKACERIVGRTELQAVEPLTTDEPAEVAA